MDEKTGMFIQGLRIDKGMTQAQLAELLGISDRAVSKWETGKSFPDVSILKPLAKILDVSVLELLDGQRQTETPLSGKAAEESFFKGLQFYLRMKDRRRRLYIVLLVICLALICIGGIRGFADMCEEAKQPMNLADGDYSFTNIDLNLGDSSDEIIQVILDQPEDEMIKDAIKNLLLGRHSKKDLYLSEVFFPLIRRGTLIGRVEFAIQEIEQRKLLSSLGALF